MRTADHIYISASIGLFVYAAYGEIGPAITSFLVGTLIDLDHIVDYLYAHGKKWDWKKIKGAYHEHHSGKLYIPLHSYELLLLYFFLTISPDLTPWRVGVTLSVLVHFFCDQIFNPHRKFSTYFLISRIIHKFDANKILNKKTFHHKLSH